uniref:Uncharacterized protein n=1 Tax=Lates calcarifer TaxID=8187 RepID=A0A4W6CC68_LATCA
YLLFCGWLETFFPPPIRQQEKWLRSLYLKIFVSSFTGDDETFRQNISPHLTRIKQKIMHSSKTPSHPKGTSIKSLRKPDRDTILPSIYCPLLLHYNEIIIAALADRVDTITPL